VRASFPKNMSNNILLQAGWKCPQFSHFIDLHLVNNADSAKNTCMTNAAFIENRTTSERNDVFYKSLVRPSESLFEVNVFVPFSEKWSKPESAVGTEPICKAFFLPRKLCNACAVRKWHPASTNVCIVNENKHTAWNKRRNERCC